MRNCRLSFRVTEQEKEELVLNAKKEQMGMSEYILSCVNDKKQLSELSDSQGQFLNLFDIAYKRSEDPFFKQQMMVLNKISFNVMWLLNAQNLFMKQIVMKHDKDDIITSFVDHPIMSITHEETLKEIRTMKQKKADEENGIE